MKIPEQINLLVRILYKYLRELLKSGYLFEIRITGNSSSIRTVTLVKWLKKQEDETRKVEAEELWKQKT